MTWLAWLIIVLVLLIFEISTPSMLFFTCIAAGALGGAIASFVGVSHLAQYLIFAFIALFSIFAIRPVFKKWLHKSGNVKTNVDALIGRFAIVTEKITITNGGFVKIDGEIWLAYADLDIEAGESVKVEKVDGTRLRVVR